MLASVGFAQAAVDVVVRDTAGNPLPVGTVGEVTVRGPTVMRGYWNNPPGERDDAAERVRSTPATSAASTRAACCTCSSIVRRILIISGGSNIYPREVEEALLAHPAVREVAVIGVAGSALG